MQNSKVILLCILACTAICCTTYFLLQRQLRKTAVVDAVKLFDGFNMKKELENKAKTKLQKTSKILDSLENALRMARAKGNNEEISKITYSYTYAKANLENEYKQSNHDINEQVWKRLNGIIDFFGKEKNLHFIVGANGMGSVLYVDNHYDITNELIVYANKKYEEGN